MNRKRLGKCYELASHELLERDDGARLVHGTILRESAPNPHAWLEWDSPDNWWWHTIEGWQKPVLCWEPVSQMTLPKDAFDRFFGAVKHHEYNRKEACKWMLKTKHHGPWQ